MITIEATIRDLTAHSGNGMRLFWTPGAEQPYWARQASFSQDVAVASPEDFAVAQGWDADGFDCLEPAYVEENGDDVCRLTLINPFKLADVVEQYIDALRAVDYDDENEEGRYKSPIELRVEAIEREMQAFTKRLNEFEEKVFQFLERLEQRVDELQRQMYRLDGSGGK